MKKNTDLLLGAHVSIAGGFDQSIIRAEAINSTCMQIFTKNNKQWHAKSIIKEEADLFKSTLEKSSIKMVIAHASYLINIGSPQKDLNLKSAAALSEEIKRCEMLNIPYLILHPGSSTGESVGLCLERVIHNLNVVLEENPGTCTILLENTAGQGSAICSTLEELSRVYNKVKSTNRVGICIDTCHAFAAGYDLRTAESYANFWQSFDAALGIESLKAFHLNDSKKELGSAVDRHENIGDGKLGLEAFRLIMNDERLLSIPKIIETPKGEDLKNDMLNLKTLKDLLIDESQERFFS
jgi:deoxyribonuclease-4